MKKTVSFGLLVLINVLLFTGCSNSVGSVDTISSESTDDALTDDNSSAVGEQPHQTISSSEETALAAYSSFLSGDSTLLDGAQLEKWWIPDFQDENMTYEYTYLDLDGDGVVELLIQMEDAPYNYNGVFHFENGKIICWNSDAMEMSCWDYPLNDGTMVRQYDINGNSTYSIFRYTTDGETEDIHTLFVREESVPEDSSEPCPYYAIDGEEVDKTVFEEQLDTLVTGEMLERSDWTII